MTTSFLNLQEIVLSGEDVSLWNDQQPQETIQEEPTEISNTETKKLEKIEPTKNTPSGKPEVSAKQASDLLLLIDQCDCRMAFVA